MKKVYIIHGWEGASDRDWIGWAADTFKTRGYEVSAPDMPNTEAPVIKEWVDYLSELVKSPDQDTYFIGHSIGCQTIMRYLEKIDVRVGGAIFVAGWFDLINLETEEQKAIAEPWIKIPIDTNKVHANLGYSVAMLGDNDEWVPFEQTKKEFEDRLGSEIVVMHGNGHITSDDGFGAFPKLVEVFDNHV